jgi:AraC-like DNA-binding protein
MTPEAPLRALYADVPRPVVALASEYPPGHATGLHRHPRGQLIFATAGVMSVAAPAGSWIVPPERAVWIPAGVAHAVETRRGVSMRSIYVARDRCAVLPDRPTVVVVSPLLRALILEAARLPALYDEAGADGRLVAVLIDRIRATEIEPLHLPDPADPRAARVAAALKRDPGSKRTLAEWGRYGGAGARTLARLFLRDTGLSFGQWRTRLRLQQALLRLAEGRPVTGVAFDLGYDSVGSFVSMFRQALGVTPRRYFRRPPADPAG